MFLLLFLSALWSILKLITSSLVLFDSRSVDTLPPTVSINGELRPPSPFMPDPFNRSRSILRGITMNWSIDQRPAITGGYKLIVLFRPIGFTYPNERFGAFNQIAAPRYAKIYSSFEKKKWIGIDQFDRPHCRPFACETLGNFGHSVESRTRNLLADQKCRPAEQQMKNTLSPRPGRHGCGSR